MSQVMFLISTKSGKAYRVLDIDKVNKTITLQGANSPFTEAYDVARLKETGYRPEMREVDDAIVTKEDA